MTQPSDENLLRAYKFSPWPHVKFLRLCSAVAMLDYQVKARRPDGGADVLREDYPLWALLREPNPVLTGWDFTFLTELYVRTTGSVFWRITRGPLGRPAQLWVMPSFWVQPLRDPMTRRVTEYRLPFQPGETVPARDMVWLHVPDPMDPYMKGVGDMLALATEIETFEYASEADKNFFLRDAIPAGTLEVPGTPMPEERKRIRESWQRAYGGFMKYGEIPLLWGGMKFQKIRETRKEMDFVDGQKYLRDVIIAGVHPHILGISEGVNRAQAEAAEYTFARWEILPRAKWNAEVRNKYLAPQFDRRAFIEYINVVPADVDRLLAVAADMSHAITVDERRAVLAQAGVDVKPIGGSLGNSLLLPLMIVPTPVNEEGNGGQPGPNGERPTPTPAPAPAPTEEPSQGATPRAVVKVSLQDVLRALGPLERVAADLFMILRPAYVTVLDSRWARAAEEVGLAAAFDVANPRVAQFLREAGGQRIKDIAEVVRERLRGTLAEGAEAGEGIPALVERVGDVFDDAKGSRAVTIARTETLLASNTAAEAAYAEAGVQAKEWLLAPDYTPEIDDGECEPYDGKTVPMGEEFSPGIQFPPLHPNCRCTIAPVFIEDGEERRMYDGEHRKRHITAVGAWHARLERVMLNAVKRGWQQYQNQITRRLRHGA